MKKIISVFAFFALSLSAFAQESKPSVEVHGFIRNYYAFDSRKMIGLTEDFFTYVPYDVENVVKVRTGEEGYDALQDVE